MLIYEADGKSRQETVEEFTRRIADETYISHYRNASSQDPELSESEAIAIAKAAFAGATELAKLTYK